MNIFKSSKNLYILAFIVLILTNLVVILGVYSNRNSSLTNSITLTERELQLSNNIYDENSGVSLRIKWRVYDENKNISYYYNKQASWLDTKKLQTLGFNTAKILKQKKYTPTGEKEVFLVLELDGFSYQKALEKSKNNIIKIEEENNNNIKTLKNAKKALHVEQISSSRVFVIDAGINYNKLREKYKDIRNIIIVKGIVKVHHEILKKELHGYVSRLSVASLHVDIDNRGILRKLTNLKRRAYNTEKSPRYKVKVTYGNRYEPWIENISKY